jgi:fatty acid desaturase
MHLILSDRDDTAPCSHSVAASLRRRFAREIGRMGITPRPVGVAVSNLVLHIALGVAAAWLNAWVMVQVPLAGWLLYPPVAFFIGTRFRALGNMIHEASHGMLVPGKRNNRLLGHLLCIIDFTAFQAYTREHITHHRYLGNPERDLDFKQRWRFGFGRPTGRMGARHLGLPLMLIHLPTYLRPVLWNRDDSLPVSLARIAFLLGLVALASGLLGWQAFGLFYLVPYLVTYQIIRYWSDALDHAGIISARDEYERARNHAFRFRLLNRLLFPRNDEYHLTHHLFPAVPTWAQPEVHRLLLQSPEYAARRHDMRAAV